MVNLLGHTYLSRLLFVVLSAFLLCSCLPQNEDAATTVVFAPQISMRHQDILNYDLGPFATEAQTLITIQPSQSTISTLRVDSITQHIHYVYQPQPDYIGQELVVIDTKALPIAEGPSPTAVRFKFYIDISY